MLFIFGIALGLGLLVSVMWLRKSGISVKWYNWIIGLLGLVLLAFTLQSSFTFFGESKTQAAWMSLLVIGIPAIILLAAASLLVWWHNHTAQK